MVVVGISMVGAVVLIVFPRELVVRGFVVAEFFVVSVPVSVDSQMVEPVTVLTVESMAMVIVVKMGIVRNWMAVWVIVVIDWVVVSFAPDVILL